MVDSRRYATPGRDGRVVEGARLESVFRGNSNVGSNPTLSASPSGLESTSSHPAYRSVEAKKKGGLAEWLKAHAWKACLGETLTWVRIPLSPPAQVVWNQQVRILR